ncbi:PKD domain-containing protein, partial [Candidatus Bipolaricaulota bacterium]|nr:PKD domain-containing protein [Candidatus Bipolaricaulota bacterium]
MNAFYVLEVDRQCRWCKTLTLTSPLLLDAGILHSITHEYGIAVGDTVSSETKIIPPVLDLGELNELKLPFGKKPVFKSVTESKNQGFEQGKPQLPDCEIADVQVQQDEVYDFGDVTVGTTAYLEVPLGCLYHDFCWLDAIVQYPSAPFQVVSAPIGEPIYRGGRKTIGVRFTPQGCGYFSGTLIVRYCYGNFPEEEPHPMHLGKKGDLNPQWFRCIEVPCYLHGRAVGPPIARCSHRPEHPTPGETVFFSSQGSYACDPEGILARYEWDFDDGSTSHLPNPTHRFAKVGTYVVRLTVWDNTGYQSQPCWCRVEVVPDVAELIGATAVAVAAGVVSHAVLAKPPVLPPPAFGFAAALVPASIVAISEFCSYPVDQLIVGLPEGMSLSEARQLVRDIVPDAEIVGFSAPLSACLVRFPSLQAMANQEQAVRVLEKMSDEFEKRMPEGAWVLKNYLGTPEQIEDSATFRCDLDRIEVTDRQAYETIHAREAWELLSHLHVRLKPVRVAVIDSGVQANHAKNEFNICLTGVYHCILQ